MLDPLVRAGALAVPLISVLLVGSGCIQGTGPRAVGEPCGHDGECTEGLVCSYGRCRSECMVDRDCGEGEACVAASGEDSVRVCVAPEGAGPCGEGEVGACPQSLLCGPDGACHEPCEGEPPACGSDRVCFGGLCLEPGALPPYCDDDGDGELDPACGGEDCSDDGQPVLVPASEVSSIPTALATEVAGPAVAWSPEGWGLAWAQRNGAAEPWALRSTVVTLDGSTVQAPRDLVVVGEAIEPPAITWAGGGFAVGAASATGSWAHVFYAPTDRETGAFFLELPGSSFVGAPSVAFDGSAIGAVWVDGGGERLFATEWQASTFAWGMTVGWSCGLAECSEPSVAAGTAEHHWVVVYRESALDGSDGHIAIVDVGVDPSGAGWRSGGVGGEASSRLPDLVRAVGGYGLAWVEGPPSSPVARFARLSEGLEAAERASPAGAGEALGLEAARLGWDGEAFVVAWAGDARGGEAGIQASRRPSAGGDAWSSVLVSAEDLETGRPDIAGSAGSWAVAWWATRAESGGTPALLISLVGTCY